MIGARERQRVQQRSHGMQCLQGFRVRNRIKCRQGIIPLTVAHQERAPTLCRFPNDAHVQGERGEAQ
eukprot:9806958-Lingulodinium_polyedra.AAC.1